MGGSHSIEKGGGKRGSKRSRERQQWQSERQGVLPTENSTNSYNFSGTGHFGYNSQDTFTYTDNQTGFVNFSNLVEVPRYYDYSENRHGFDQQNRNNNYDLSEDAVDVPGVNSENLDGCLQGPSSANNIYSERKFRRPVRRHHSLDENRLQFQSGQDTVNDFYSSPIRCSSLDRGYKLEAQYTGYEFTNFSSFNLPTQDHAYDRSRLRNCSTYDVQTSVGDHGSNNHSSSDGFSDDMFSGDGSDGACGGMLLFDSPVRPCVKRRRSDESQESYCSSDNNGNGSDVEREIEHSDSLSWSSPTGGSGDVCIARFQSDETCSALDILSYPSEWSACTLSKTGYVNISLSSAEGISIQNFFQRTCKTRNSYLSISAITRIQNPFLHTLYLLKKEEMTVRNGHVDELFLYHGTKKRHVSNICENNLDWRQHSEEHRFGKGVSFSPSASYSSHYSDNRGSDKILMLFKVLVSNSVLGLPEMSIPLGDGDVSYDTSIKEDTSVIVKYNDNEFYPLYKILYNKFEMHERR